MVDTINRYRGIEEEEDGKEEGEKERKKARNGYKKVKNKNRVIILRIIREE